MHCMPQSRAMRGSKRTAASSSSCHSCRQSCATTHAIFSCATQRFENYTCNDALRHSLLVASQRFSVTLKHHGCPRFDFDITDVLFFLSLPHVHMDLPIFLKAGNKRLRYLVAWFNRPRLCLYYSIANRPTEWSDETEVMYFDASGSIDD